MPSFVPLRRTYSAISSPWSSPDDTHNANIKEIVVQPSDSSPRTIHRHSFLIRFIIFAILEFSLIALISAALRRPILLHVSFTNSEVKGAVTVVAIAWHALAVSVVKDILLNVFSAEWMGQYDESQRFTLQELDIVSRLTTGLIDHAKHCMSTHATLPFRLSFLSLLLLMLLNGLGPSAIGIDLVYHDYQATTQVANLTLWNHGSPNDGFLFSVESRANALLQLEIMQNIASAGFSGTQPNILIPWPSSDSVSENVSIAYESDVIWYNTSCSWKAPSIDEDTITLLNADTNRPEQYTIIVGTGVQNLPAMVRLIAAHSDSSITFTPILFIRLNNSLGRVDIPSLLVPCNATFYSLNFKQLSSDCTPILLSALFCDPQLKVLPATVNVTMSSLQATILPGTPTVKNIPTEAANYLFSSALNNAIETTTDITAVIFRLLFNSVTFTDLLATEQINQNMTKAFASAAKAYLSGYMPGGYTGSTIFPSFAMVNTSAVIEEQRLALVGRKPFFVASSAIAGLLVVLLGVIVAITRPDQLESFELENIIRKLN